MSDFNPNSLDAVVSRITTRLDQQDKDAEARHRQIVGKFDDHEKRLSTLENEKWFQRGIVATISAGLTAVGHYLAGGGHK